MSAKSKGWTWRQPKLSLGMLAWLGGAFHVAAQPGHGFWDGVIWMWYVGRYIATHFTALTPL
jgi:hypothetical protein